MKKKPQHSMQQHFLWAAGGGTRLFIEQQKELGKNGLPRAYLGIQQGEKQEEEQGRKEESAGIWSVKNVCGQGESRNKARATRNR